jgi:hypothetical protein
MLQDGSYEHIKTGEGLTVVIEIRIRRIMTTNDLWGQEESIVGSVRNGLMFVSI